jgi:hypothetical protein
MPSVLTFKETYNYGAGADGVTVPIALTHGAKRIKLFAKLDTGAPYCIFKREHGEALGLDIESGYSQTMRTANSSFETFGHEVNIESFGWQTTATVYFSAERDFSRNVLGRNGWIRQFRLGLIDYDSTLYISHHDEA